MAPRTIIKRRMLVRGRVAPDGTIYNAKAKTISKPVAKAVRKIAAAAVSKAAEDKFVTVQDVQTFNQTITNVGDVQQIVPLVTPGFTDYQRIGDKIRGKYLYLKGKVQYDNDFIQSSSIGPSTVRVLVLSQRTVKSASQIANVDILHILKDNVGTGSARAYTGGEFDNLAPINKELFTVHLDKKIRFNWHSEKATTSDQVGNDRTKYFYCKIKCPKTMYFDPANGDAPVNFCPFMLVGGVNDDGQGAWTAGQPYRVAWSATMYYEDS